VRREDLRNRSLFLRETSIDWGRKDGGVLAIDTGKRKQEPRAASVRSRGGRKRDSHSPVGGGGWLGIEVPTLLWMNSNVRIIGAAGDIS